MAISYILSLLVSTASLAETVSGKLYCSNANTDDIKTVVVFLNGISNTLDGAETSRQLLQAKLRSVCNGTDCVVQKFYNKADGLADDIQELSFVGGLERDSANSAFRRLVIEMKIGYLRYKASLEKNPNINVDDYKENDEKVWKELKRMYDEAKDSSSDSQIVFSAAGSNITEWLINHLLSSEDILSPYSSIYLASMKNKELLYDAKYKYYYSSTLTEYYLSKREFYGSDANADKAVTRTVEGLVTYLEEHMLSGKKIVVVAHSQGNHMIELAYGILKEKWGLSAVKSIQVVGVAAVASTTPSDTYLTWDDDDIVLNSYDNASYGDPLVGNFSVTDQSPADGTNDHSFTEVYLNHNLRGRYNPNGRGNLSGVQEYLSDTNTEYPVDDWIIGLIKGSIDAARPYISEISSTGFITATLRWEQYSDMDLWTNENDEHTVFYEDMTGTYGSLDRDDTDGDGPEHYTANIECTNAGNKTWKFGIHQYPSGGSSAIAHFSIKIGNAILQHKSYSLTSWPSSTQWIGTVTLGEVSQSSVVPYSITISDKIAN